MQVVGVIGAGQMGSGIAQTIAQNGIQVLLSDVDIALAEKAKAGIDRALTKLVSRDRLSSADPKRRWRGLPRWPIMPRWPLPT